MNKSTTSLRIFIYGKNALEDIKYICKNVDMNLSIDKRFGGNMYVTKDKEINYEYFIVSDGISEEKNKMIINYLEEHYKSENMAKAGEAINQATEKCKKEANLKDLKDEDSDDDTLYNNNSYNLYNEKLSKIISDKLLEFRKFYDIIVFCVDTLSGKDSEIAFKSFQGFTKIFAQQPFLLFLTKKENVPKISNLFKLVTNEFFDKRNVFAYKYPTNDEEIEKINNYFVKCMNYYHEIGNNDINNESQTFNMLICGRAGVGKSSFINQFLNEKVAKEGEGLSITQEITNYRHPKYKIKIFDTPGFESDITVEKVYRTIKKFEKDIKDSKNHLDLIIYFNDLSSRTFFSLETRLIKHLIKQKKKLMIVLNDKSNNTKKNREKLLDVFKDSIKKIVNTMENKDKIDVNDIIKNMVVINLKQSVEEEEEDDDDNDDDEENSTKKKKKIKIRQTFGMDQLFNKIYEMLKNHQIRVYEIEKSNNMSELIKNVSKYELLNHIKNIEDIHINIKIESAKLILSYAKYDWFVWFYRDKRRKELLYKINTLNKGSSINDIESLFSNIKYKVDNISNKKESINQFFDGIRKFKGIFATQGFNFNAYFYNEYTLLIGYEFLKQFEKDYGEYDEKSKKFLTDLCNTFNEAIDDFEKLSKEWKETYKSLKDHKTDKEWIKKFFIVEVPTKIE